MKNYYKIMEVAPNASPNEIKQAYHRLAHKFHPDKSQEPNAEQRFQEINEAYEVLKDPQKRAVYNTRVKVILPYSYNWFMARQNAWMRTVAQLLAKQNAWLRVQFLGRAKKNPGIYTHAKRPTIEDSSMKPTQKFHKVFIALFVLILSAITIGVIFVVEQIAQWQDYQQVQTGILQGDKKAIETLEQADLATQKNIIEGEQVKKALVHFYLQQPQYPLWTKLGHYDESISIEILKDDDVYRTLIAHYYSRIEAEIEADNFDKALSWLDILKKKYPNSTELSDKYEAIESQKQQRLADLIQQYGECLNQTLKPLLDRTHCMVEAREKIMRVGIEHNLPMDANLPAMYALEVQQALTAKNYAQAEKLLSDWEKLLPEASEQRDALKSRLALHKEVKMVIADLTSSDRNKIVTRLSQIATEPSLKQALLEQPKIQNHLLKFHLNEALALLRFNEEEVKLKPTTKNNLENLLIVVRDETSEFSPLFEPTVQQVTTTQRNNKWLKRLQECERHYQANRLTTGKGGTALNCYKTILKQEPGNPEALAGLKAIENRYKLWAEAAFQQNRLDRVKIYLSGIQKVNPKSRTLKRLRKRLNQAVMGHSSKPQSSTIRRSTPENTIISCEGCTCSNILKQLSMGVTPLTMEQRDFLQTQCR
jgi:DnaJ-domain-containing protein 1